MEEEKLKILFVSDLVAPTGFATVSHNIIKHNREIFDITGLGVNYKGDPHSYDFPIYPAMAGMQGNIYGLDRLVNILNQNKFDIVYILNDVWVISYYLDTIKKNVTKELPKFVVYFPVDSRFHNKQWYKDFDIVSKAFTYTQFGVDVVKEVAPDLDIGIIPHGVDSQTFYKMHDTKGESKFALLGKSVYDMGNPEELFFVLNANRNQPRKRLDVTMEGFALFAKDKPETVRLYMHCGVRDSAVDVSYLSFRYGINERLIMTNLTPGIQRVSEERLNMIYNACDIGINTSLGEGWGLTNMEHAITGAVQIVPRHSSCEEIFSDCGILMETVADYMFDNSQTVGKLTTPEEVARCLNILYKDKSLRKELATKAINKFVSPKYQWADIANIWRDVFIEVNKNDTTAVPQQHAHDN